MHPIIINKSVLNLAFSADNEKSQLTFGRRSRSVIGKTSDSADNQLLAKHVEESVSRTLLYSLQLCFESGL